MTLSGAKYRALWLWLRGRDAVMEKGAVAVRSSGGSLVLPVAFGVATVIEMAVLHLLVPWMWLRVILAVASVWSLVALLGYLALGRVHPHFVTDTRFVVRQSGVVVASIDRELMESAVQVRRFGTTTPEIEGSRLIVPNLDGTNVDVSLRQPIHVELPALIPRYRQSGLVDRISLYVDEPADLVGILAKVS